MRDATNCRSRRAEIPEADQPIGSNGDDRVGSTEGDARDAHVTPRVGGLICPNFDGAILAARRQPETSRRGGQAGDRLLVLTIGGTRERCLSGCCGDAGGKAPQGDVADVIATGDESGCCPQYGRVS
eukprot:scaffold7170_cov119-Isochrysis_galbana.AAC.3